MGINYLITVPLISERKGSDPHWKQVHCLFLFGRWQDHHLYCIDHLCYVKRR